jgi:hypothetical protein
LEMPQGVYTSENKRPRVLAYIETGRFTGTLFLA